MVDFMYTKNCLIFQVKLHKNAAFIHVINLYHVGEKKRRYFPTWHKGSAVDLAKAYVNVTPDGNFSLEAVRTSTSCHPTNVSWQNLQMK